MYDMGMATFFSEIYNDGFRSYFTGRTTTLFDEDDDENQDEREMYTLGFYAASESKIKWFWECWYRWF